MATIDNRLVVEDALSAGARAVVLDPELIESLDADQLLQIGRELRSRDPHLALRAHLRATQRVTGRPRAHALVTLAATQRKAQQPSEALDSISEALELDDSPHVTRMANTSRVGALRDLGELPRAQALGERLERMYPDDPKVLRALAAVYGELSRDADDMTMRADRLFALANELDALAEDGFDFADLTNVTPQLEALLDRAGYVADPGGESFCAFEQWIEAFRPQLEAIASLQHADPRLQSHRAYTLVALLVYRRLPPCRDCGRIYNLD
jgi:tetratricopeptide (TPR) repeat protein